MRFQAWLPVDAETPVDESANQAERPVKMRTSSIVGTKKLNVGFSRCSITAIRRNTMFEGLFQPMHLIILFVIAVLVLGPRKLPELGKGLGEGIRSFKSAIKEASDPNEAR
jgi:sec-independent protein translocase protein TatA